MPSLRPLFSRSRKSLPVLVLLAGVLGIEILYLATANPLLASSFGRGLLLRHPRLKISYQRAWTPLPGVIVTRGLRLHYTTAISSWTATADRAAGVIIVPQLLLKRFHLAGLRASGVDFHFARLPAEVAGVPRGRRGPPPARPWRLRISQAHFSDVGSLIVNDRGFEGSATVEGGFDVSLAGLAEVHRSSANVRTGRFWVGDRELARDVQGVLRARIDNFEYRKYRGRQVMPFVSGSIDGKGQASAAQFLGFFLRRLDWLTWEGESSELAAELRMDHGQLQPGSKATFAPQVLQTRYLDYTIAGEGDVHWAVVTEGDAGSAESRIDATFAKYQVRREGNQEPHIFGGGLTVRGSGKRTALLEAFSGLRLRIDMPEAEVPDLEIYGSYLPASSGLAITGGSGRIAGWLEMDAADGSGNGELQFDVDKASASYSGLPLSGALSIHTPLRQLDFAGRRFDISGTEVKMTGVCAGDCAGADQTGWWGKVKLVRASLAPGNADTVSAELQAELRDSRPLVLLFATRAGLPGWVQKMLTVENVATRANLKVGSGGVSLRELVGSAEKMEVRARLDFRPRGRAGQIYLRYGVLGVGMDLAGGDRDLRFLKPLEWYQNGGRNGPQPRTAAPPAKKRRWLRGR